MLVCCMHVYMCVVHACCIYESLYCMYVVNVCYLYAYKYVCVVVDMFLDVRVYVCVVHVVVFSLLV